MPGRPGDSILPHPAVFAATFTVTGVAWWLAGRLWSSGDRTWALSAFALGLSLGPCLTAYLTAPRRQRPRQLRIVLLSGGLGLLAPALLAATGLDLGRLLLLLFARGG
jgi:hypothetical protein